MILSSNQIKYTDNRGTLFFPINKHNDKLNGFNQHIECTVSINNKDVFRGIHINSFNKLITCIKGKILDILINFDKDADDYCIPKYYILDPKTEVFQVFCPKNYGHAFLSLEQDSILIYHFDGHFSDIDTKHVHWKDPRVNLKLPIQEPILSEKDNKII